MHSQKKKKLHKRYNQAEGIRIIRQQKLKEEEEKELLCFLSRFKAFQTPGTSFNTRSLPSCLRVNDISTPEKSFVLAREIIVSEKLETLLYTRSLLSYLLIDNTPGKCNG